MVVGQGLSGIYLGIGLTTWVGVCRNVRGEVMRHRLPFRGPAGKGDVLRRTSFALTTLAILVLLAVCAAPALAASASRVPANEAAIAKMLKHEGKIPRGASAAQVKATVESWLQKVVGSKSEDRANLGNGPAPAVTPNGLTPWGRVMAATPGATLDNALVILVEFPQADLVNPPGYTETFPGGPLHGLILPPAAAS